MEAAIVFVGLFGILFFIGAALFVITFFLNLAGHAYVGRLKRKLSG